VIAFNEFIHERETKRSDDPSIKLFDQIILSKKNRGRTSLFSKSSEFLRSPIVCLEYLLSIVEGTDFLSDTSDHLWRTAVATPPNARFPGDYRQVVSRSKSKRRTLHLKQH